MLPFATCFLAGVLVALAYRIVRHKSIFPQASFENIYFAWTKIIITILFPFSVLWIAFLALQSFPD